MYFCIVIYALLVAVSKYYYCMTCRVIGKIDNLLNGMVVIVVMSGTNGCKWCRCWEAVVAKEMQLFMCY